MKIVVTNITVHLLRTNDPWSIFIRPSRDGPYYVIGYGGHPHDFFYMSFIVPKLVYKFLERSLSFWIQKHEKFVYFCKWRGIIPDQKFTVENNTWPAFLGFWLCVYISNDLFIRTSVIEWKPNAGCTYISIWIKLHASKSLQHKYSLSCEM
jgi:hypothetical protein